jgi:hypothetical protein
MGKDLPFLQQAEILSNAYGAQVLARMLGITERAVNTWTEKKPKVPREATQRKLQELFLKHESGIDIRTLAQPDLKEELLESYRDQVAYLKERLNLVAQEIADLGRANQALAMTNQNMLIELLAQKRKAEPRKVAFEMNKANDVNYESAKEAGNILETRK